MKSKSTIIRYGLSFFLFVLIMLSSFLFVKTNAKQVAAKSNLPFILVPGTSATEDRFDGFIDKMIKKVGGKDILKIEVQKDGSLQWTSTLTNNSAHPYIVISFADSSEEAVAKQAKWIKLALDKAHELYIFDAYNALGHSNGGLAWTMYLENEPIQTTHQMKKLVTLGTPFDCTLDLENRDPKGTSMVETDMLQTLSSSRDRIPKNLTMISIAGDIGKTGSDGMVSVESALASQGIYKGQVNTYIEKVFYGEDSQHSELIGNSDVMDYIVQELYG